MFSLLALIIGLAIIGIFCGEVYRITETRKEAKKIPENTTEVEIKEIK